MTVGAHLRKNAASGIAISEIVLGELRFGAARHPTKRELLERLTGDFVVRANVLPWAASAHYARLRAELEAAGTPIGAMDMSIAAHALERGATLVTNDTRHFSRVDGLSIVNWTSS